MFRSSNQWRPPWRKSRRTAIAASLSRNSGTSTAVPSNFVCHNGGSTVRAVSSCFGVHIPVRTRPILSARRLWPSGWTPEIEADHFVQCPGCGAWVDMRSGDGAQPCQAAAAASSGQAAESEILSNARHPFYWYRAISYQVPALLGCGCSENTSLPWDRGGSLQYQAMTAKSVR
jgi:hypothetical protein